ncbi:13131_t:CDS:2 [Gigaspora rosea]|nr:13131_t:CDS:2 [Gigaspora rosea]
MIKFVSGLIKVFGLNEMYKIREWEDMNEESLDVMNGYLSCITGLPEQEVAEGVVPIY